MRIELACFTDRGEDLGKRLRHMLEADGDTARLERCGDGGRPLRQWVDERFQQADALIFIGAVGIAVRAVAPAVVSKLSDPAVVAVDDCGRFAVSLLSGHVGGANALAERIAGRIGATPVVTTATDARGVFAVDVWARDGNLAICNPERIKRVSAKLLAGGRAILKTPFPVAGCLPEGLVAASGDAADIVVDIRAADNAEALHLAPRIVVLGVGCRKGTSPETVAAAFAALRAASGIVTEAFAKVCSIDLKQNESGLVTFCESLRLPFETFSAERLMQTRGDFTASDFVQDVTGADNVCERSAVAGGGRNLIVRKTVFDGVTMAAALCKYALRFPEDSGDDGKTP